MEKKVYQENITHIKKFYMECSSFCDKELTEKERLYIVKKMIEAMYLDPDNNDDSILERARNLKVSFGNELEFSADGICGWKILYDVYGDRKGATGDISWLKKYEIIRGSKRGELYFPCKMDGKKQTINQSRNSIGDRVDWLLFCIKEYFKNQKSIMIIENSNSIKFLNYFQKENRDWKDALLEFAKFEGWEFLVNEKGDILDLSKIHLEESDDTLYLIDDGLCYVADKDENGNDTIQWSNNFSIRRKQEVMQGYLDNVCKICAWNGKIIIKKKSDRTLL